MLEPLSHPVIQNGLLEILLVGIPGGVLGCWIVLYATSYAAESLAHSLFPGLVLASLAGFSLLIGAAGAALLAALAIALAGRVPGVGRDTAVGIVVTTMFGAGVLLALSPASPPGIQELLFGNVLGVSNRDLLMSGVLGLVVLVGLRVLHGRLLLVGFDRPGAASLGASPSRIDAALLVLTALAVLVAVQALGNLLVVAILVGPAAAARQLTDRLRTMMLLAAGLAALAGLAGLYLSYYAGTAAGASIAAAVVVAYLACALLSPRPALPGGATEAA